MFGKINAIAAILFWFLLGSYTGIAGLIFEDHQRKEDSIKKIEETRIAKGEQNRPVIIDQITFSCQERADLYIDEITTYKLFGWILKAPAFLILVISSCGLGAFGGIIGIVRSIAFDKTPIENTQYIVIPFLGFMLGMVILAISYLLPAILITESDIQIRQTTLMCFSLFAGLFSKPFFIWLEIKFGDYVKEKDNKSI